MAKSKLKILAHRLRHKGLSLKEIADKLRISKNTASLWCREVQISKKGLKRLTKRCFKKSYLGRLKGAHIQREKKIRKINFFEKQGKQIIKELSQRDLLIAGIMLYSAEGYRKGNNIQFANLDPKIIKFIILWFQKIFHIDKNRFRPWIGINKTHYFRTEQVKKYWSKITNIPSSQFNKTILIKAMNKKVYKNFAQHYGTLYIRILKSANLKYQIDGLIKAIL